MPVITVKGIPKKTTQKILNDIHESLILETTHIESLKLSENDIDVFFPQDLRNKSLSNTIIISIDELFVKLERDEHVRQALAKRLTVIARTFFPNSKVECLIHPFDPRQGFYVIE